MPSPRAEPARLFLIGCPRSGTTLLQALMARHASVTTFPETHFFAVCFNAKLPLLRGWSGRRALRRAARVANVRVHEPGLLALALARPRRYVDAFIAALDDKALAAGTGAWLEKTPRHVFFVREISATVEQAQFIHLIRDGRATVASLYDIGHKKPDGVWQRYRSLEYCIERWNRSVTESLRWRGQPNHHFASYEEITRDSSAVLQRLCRDIGMNYFETPRADAHTLSEFSEPHETWKAGSASGIYDYGLEKYERIFDAAQRRQIEAALVDPTMKLAA